MTSQVLSRFDRPVFIIAAPRSGSTLLYETLVRHPDLVSLQNESHAVIEHIPELSTVKRGFTSNALFAKDATPAIRDVLTQRFLAEAVTHTGEAIAPSGDPVRFLEKTPKNALRVSFLQALYPDAKFIYLVREPVANTASIIDAWQSGHFVTYPNLPGWQANWSLLLPPGWQSMRNRPLADIAAFQWAQANTHASQELAKLDPAQVLPVTHHEFLADPQHTINRIFNFAELTPQPDLLGDAGLPLSRYTLFAPSKDKWHRHAAAIAAARADLEQATAEINKLMQSFKLPGIALHSELDNIAKAREVQGAEDRENFITPPASRNAPCPCGSGRKYKQCHGTLS